MKGYAALTDANGNLLFVRVKRIAAVFQDTSTLDTRVMIDGNVVHLKNSYEEVVEIINLVRGKE